MTAYKVSIVACGTAHQLLAELRSFHERHERLEGKSKAGDRESTDFMSSGSCAERAQCTAEKTSRCHSDRRERLDHTEIILGDVRVCTLAKRKSGRRRCMDTYDRLLFSIEIRATVKRPG